MKIFIASDHAGFDLKTNLIFELSKHHEVVDLGTHSPDSTHYPDWVNVLVQKVRAENNPGILICGSGIGVSMAANRYRHIRAALCRDEDDARMSRLHNNANVLCLSARKTPLEMALKMTEAFLITPFEGGRHQLRINLFDSLGD